MEHALVHSAFYTESELEVNRFTCRFYVVGSCSDGPYCPLPHVQDPRRIPDTTCRFYWKGKCIYGKTCWYDHVYFKMKGQIIIMTLHKDQAQYRCLLRKAEEDKKKKIKENEDTENIIVLPSSHEENLVLNDNNHTSGCELESKGMRSTVKAEEGSSYNPFLNYDKGFPCLSEKKETKPEFLLKTALKPEGLHFLLKKQIKTDDTSQQQTSDLNKDGENSDYFPKTHNEPAKNIQLKSSDFSDVFQQQSLNSSKDGVYYMQKRDSKLNNIHLKTSDNVDVVQEINSDLNTYDQNTWYEPRNKTSASTIRNDNIPSSSNVLHNNLLQWYAKKHAFQQDILGLNKIDVSTYSLSRNDSAFVATENINSITPSSNILSCNLKNSIKDPASQKQSINKGNINIYYFLKNHNFTASAENTISPQTSNVLYSNLINGCTKTYALQQKILNLDKDQMNIYSSPRNNCSVAATGNISIPPTSKFVYSNMHKTIAGNNDGLKKKLSLNKIVTNTCSLQRKYSSLDPQKSISSPVAYKEFSTLFGMSRDSCQQSFNFNIDGMCYHFPRNAVITTKNVILPVWIHFPIMINLNHPDMSIMTIQQDFQKMMSPVPEQIWNSEYPLPKEFYSNSTKTSRLSIYLNTKKSAGQNNR